MHEYSEKPAFNQLTDIAGKKITVMGLGLNGGGEAVVRFFLKHGAIVTVTDMKTKDELKATIDKLENDKSINTENLYYVLGEHRIEDFQNADCVIKNPGVKYEGNKYLSQAKCIETDLSLFLHFSKAPVIAVTGSKGKSSTVSAIHYALKKLGYNAFLGGNITVSPLSFLEKTDSTTPVVLELSSWQLSDLCGRKLLKPKVSVITLIVPDHQNWYHSMEKYVADKKLIYAEQNENDYTLCNADDDWGKIFACETKAKVIFYDDKNLPENLKVPGKHMQQNVKTAALAVSAFSENKFSYDDVISVLKDFPGIEHRLEFFYEWKCKDISYSFYNDSAATVPEAASAALDAFSSPIHLITGGTDKLCDFLPLAQKLTKAESVRSLKGSGTDNLNKILAEHKKEIPQSFDSLESLLNDLKNQFEKNATKKEEKNQIVLFSPGATSFGMFKNEFDRGNKFKASVKNIFI